MADDERTTFRAPMRSRLLEDDGAAVERALGLGVVGLGGRLSATPHDLADAVARTAAEHGERTAARLERFAAASDGDLVWTRDASGTYFRGVLAGPWRYDDAPAAVAVDLVHLRPCSWEPAAPPDAVLATFARGGRNWQRIRALGGRRGM
jgi:hypothetical protein